MTPTARVKLEPDMEFVADGVEPCRQCGEDCVGVMGRVVGGDPGAPVGKLVHVMLCDKCVVSYLRDEHARRAEMSE